MPRHLGGNLSREEPVPKGMASPTVAMLQILKARRQHAPQRTKVFDSYEPAYRELLTEMRSIGGDPAIDELTEWITSRTRATGRLPPPGAVAAHAREICDRRDLSIPDESPLWADDATLDPAD